MRKRKLLGVVVGLTAAAIATGAVLLGLTPWRAPTPRSSEFTREKTNPSTAVAAQASSAAVTENSPAGTLFAVISWLAGSTPTRVTRNNYDRIYEGMTRTEVQAILGPPGDYRTGLGETESDGGPRFNGPAEPDPEGEWPTTSIPSEWPHKHFTWLFWIGDTLEASVLLDTSQRVYSITSCNRRMTQIPSDAFLWRVKRQWQKWFPKA